MGKTNLDGAHKIALCITTHNRYEVFKQTLQNWLKYLPADCDLFVVDDGSAYPVKEADVRHEIAKGVAAAKNACLRLAKDYEHIFLADDDVYPLKADWHLPYIESGYIHLNFTYAPSQYAGRSSVRLKRELSDVNIFSAPHGCLMYLRKICIDTVGGFDERFGKYGYEHPNYSLRIHNTGLTPYPFMDVKNSMELFYSMDRLHEVDSAIDKKVKVQEIQRNYRLYLATKKSKEYIPL